MAFSDEKYRDKVENQQREIQSLKTKVNGLDEAIQEIREREDKKSEELKQLKALVQESTGRRVN